MKQNQLQTELQNSIKIAVNRISDIVPLVNFCKPYLDKIKQKLGKKDKLYLTISTLVCNFAQEMIIEGVNQNMCDRDVYVKFYNDYIKFQNMPSLFCMRHPITQDEIKECLSEAWSAIKIVGNLDMTFFQQKRYDNHKKALEELCNEVGVERTLTDKARYDHLQGLGKWFIKVYYSIFAKIHQS